MKRRDLVIHLEKNSCEFFPEGKKHTVYVNRSAGKTLTIPRHREVDDYLAKRICKDLEIPAP